MSACEVRDVLAAVVRAREALADGDALYAEAILEAIEETVAAKVARFHPADSDDLLTLRRWNA